VARPISFLRTAWQLEHFCGFAQDIQYVCVRVDRPPKSVLPPADRDDHFVQVPFVGRSWAVAADPGRDLRSKPLAPNPDAFIREDYASFGQKIFDIAQAQGKAMIRPHSIGNDGPRKPEPLQAEV